MTVSFNPRKCEVLTVTRNKQPTLLNCSIHDKILNRVKNKKYLSVTFRFFEICRPEWGSNPRSTTFQAGSFNHCATAPARIILYRYIVL